MEFSYIDNVPSIRYESEHHDRMRDRATLAVCGLAKDVSDAVFLLRTLGLIDDSRDSNNSDAT
jgi:hypothetical protein